LDVEIANIEDANKKPLWLSALVSKERGLGSLFEGAGKNL